MIGLGKWANAVARSSRLKARKKRSSSQGKSLLSKQEPASGSGESAVVHFARMSLLSIGNKSKMSDNDLTVVRTVETLSVAGSDVPALRQEKEVRSSGGIPSQ